MHKNSFLLHNMRDGVVDPQLLYITDEALTMPIWKLCEYKGKKILVSFSKCHYVYTVKVIVCCTVSG
jgi:hypothetical protein